MSFRSEIKELARRFNDEDEAAYNLWTWLPSHKEAEKYHGNYACEHQPSVADVMREATMFIGHKLNPTPEQVKEAGEWYQCPCGEPHGEEE